MEQAKNDRQDGRIMATVSGAWRNSRVIGVTWIIFAVMFATSILIFLPQLFVRYEVVIPPTESQLCPGDNLTYSVEVEITHFPGVATISENWCRAGESGPCSNTLAKTRSIPLAAYRKVAGSPSVPIPMSSFFNKPGPYEYWHVAVNGKSDGYIVPFMIREDCPDIPTPTPTGS
jgi:hypothetical protein